MGQKTPQQMARNWKKSTVVLVVYRENRICKYQAVKMAWKTLIEEWPDGKDLRLSNKLNLLICRLVHVYSVTNSLEEMTRGLL